MTGSVDRPAVPVNGDCPAFCANPHISWGTYPHSTPRRPLVGITPEEELELKTIISNETKRRRDRERKEIRRRSQGAKTRDEYTAQAEEKRRLVRELHGQGYGNKEIALQTGYSARHVSRILRDAGQLRG